jgi:transcriptional regulator with XRE-family HTH domain
MKKKSKTLHFPGLATLFSANLRRKRIALYLSQEQLAARAGLTTGYVSMIENGQRCPTFETVESLAGAMGIHDPRIMFHGVGRRDHES